MLLFEILLEDRRSSQGGNAPGPLVIVHLGGVDLIDRGLCSSPLDRKYGGNERIRWLNIVVIGRLNYHERTSGLWRLVNFFVAGFKYPKLGFLPISQTKIILREIVYEKILFNFFLTALEMSKKEGLAM